MRQTSTRLCIWEGPGLASIYAVARLVRSLENAVADSRGNSLCSSGMATVHAKASVLRPQSEANTTTSTGIILWL